MRRWVRIWSITDVWVMQATMRIAPWQDGHASGSTSKICCSRAAHRRVASVGANRGAGTIAGGPSAAVGAAFPRMPRGRLAYLHVLREEIVAANHIPNFRFRVCHLPKGWESVLAVWKKLTSQAICVLWWPREASRLRHAHQLERLPAFLV